MEEEPKTEAKVIRLRQDIHGLLRCTVLEAVWAVVEGDDVHWDPGSRGPS